MNKIKIVTHNASFHADDVLACATLSIYLDKKNEQYEIIRSRDTKIADLADYVVDTGGIYDSAKNRYDHHQVGGAGKHENGVPYASFGLVWKHFGLSLCEGDNEMFKKIEDELV